MLFGISNLNVIPMRSDSGNNFEIINQILFGEHFKVLKKKSKWLKVKLFHDSYSGWILSNQVVEINKKEYDHLCSNELFVNNNLIDAISSENGDMIPIIIGSILPNYNNGKFTLNNTIYSFDNAHRLPKNSKKNEIINSAYIYLNSPYLWGGRTPFGIDCSGFTQMVYRLNGINLPRDAVKQVECGKTLSFVDEAEAGDLAFFDDSDGNIVHVGIILENKRIIHSSGKVRIDKLDQQGIFNVDLKIHTHNLRLIKQIFN